jgi:hypothetical protein
MKKILFLSLTLSFLSQAYASGKIYEENLLPYAGDYVSCVARDYQKKFLTNYNYNYHYGASEVTYKGIASSVVAHLVSSSKVVVELSIFSKDKKSWTSSPLIELTDKEETLIGSYYGTKIGFHVYCKKK